MRRAYLDAEESAMRGMKNQPASFGCGMRNTTDGDI